MRYSYVSAAILAFAPAVFAQVAGFDAISVPAQDQVVKVGDVLDIKWDPNSVAGTVKLQLLEGATPATLNYDPVVIATAVNNLDGHFAWTVPASVGSFAAYGIQITLDGSADKTFQWSNHFKIQPAASSSSSVISSTAAATTSVVASTSAAATTSAVASTTAKASTIVSTTQISSTVTAPAHTTSVVVPVSSAAATPATSIPYPVNNTTVGINPTSGSSNGTKPTTLTSVASSTSKGSSPSSTLAVANSASGMAATGVLGLFGSIMLALAL